MTRWGGHALQALGVDVSNWSYYKIIGMQGTIFTRIDGVMILGMFAGCISAALWANNVKWRNQPHKRRIVQALIGGALAGFGASFTHWAVPCLSLHRYSSIFCSRLVLYYCHSRRYLCRGKSHLTSNVPREIRIEKRRGKITRNRSKTSKSSFLDWHGGLFAYLIASLYVMTNSVKLGFAMLCGLAFGLLIERAQICFTSAFRDLWVTGRAYMAKAIIFGIIVGTLGVFSYIQLGVPAKSCGRVQMQLSVVYYLVSVLC